MPVPYPTLQNGTTANSDLYQFFKFVNEGVGGVFMPSVLLSIWFIAFVGSVSEGRQGSRAFIFASFICAILSVLLSLTGLLASQYMYFLFLMVAIGVVWYKLDNAPGI